jgi:hypothetical protein
MPAKVHGRRVTRFCEARTRVLPARGESIYLSAQACHRAIMLHSRHSATKSRRTQNACSEVIAENAALLPDLAAAWYHRGARDQTSKTMRISMTPSA